jgi:hypothetical protein
MGHMLLVSGVTCLIVSWIYIFLLRAKVRDCMAYIGERIVKCNPGVDFTDGSPREERETKAKGNRARMQPNAAASAPPKEATLAGKPQLIVASSGNCPSLGYRCSHCLRSFSLVEYQPPKGAVAELFRRFREHVEQDH